MEITSALAGTRSSDTSVSLGNSNNGDMSTMGTNKVNFCNDDIVPSFDPVLIGIELSVRSVIVELPLRKVSEFICTPLNANVLSFKSRIASMSVTMDGERSIVPIACKLVSLFSFRSGEKSIAGGPQINRVSKFERFPTCSYRLAFVR